MEEIQREMKELKKQNEMLQKKLNEKVSVNEHKDNFNNKFPRIEYVYHCYKCGKDVKYKKQCNKKVFFGVIMSYRKFCRNIIMIVGCLTLYGMQFIANLKGRMKTL